METPLFSVVVPVYNKEPHLARSLESVLAQTERSFELIVVCDPSTDNSTQIARTFESDNVRVFERDKPGPGGYAARNLGIQYARGRFVAFLDADDTWVENNLEIFVRLIGDKPDARAYSCGWITRHGEDDYNDSFYEAHKQSPCEINLKEFLIFEHNQQRPLCTNTVVMEKRLLDEAGGFPDGKISMGGDVDTWVRCLAISGGLVWSNHLGSVYYRDSVNMVSKSETLVKPDLHRETALALNDNVEPDVGELIKQRSNNLVIYAWTLNLYKAGGNINLRKLMFKSEMTRRQRLAFWLSYLPNGVLRFLHKLLKNNVPA
ncbi:glycosyltransferase family 2 protein [Aliidiomarina sp. Khilg15.8]